MLSFTMEDANNLEQSLRFYDPLFVEIGLEQCRKDEQSAPWSEKFFTGHSIDGNNAHAAMEQIFTETFGFGLQ